MVGLFALALFLGVISSVGAGSARPLILAAPGIILSAFTGLGGWSSPLWAPIGGILGAAALVTLTYRLTGDTTVMACAWAAVLTGGALGVRAAATAADDPVRLRAAARASLAGVTLGVLNVLVLEGGMRAGLLSAALLPAWGALVGGLLALGGAVVLGGALAWFAIPTLVVSAVGGAWLALSQFPDSQRLALIWPVAVVGMCVGLSIAAWRLGNRKLQQTARMATAVSLVTLAPRLAAGGARSLMLPLLGVGALLMVMGRGGAAEPPAHTE
jgi:hypothetical protein